VKLITIVSQETSAGENTSMKKIQTQSLRQRFALKSMYHQTAPNFGGIKSSFLSRTIEKLSTNMETIVNLDLLIKVKLMRIKLFAFQLITLK